MTKKGRFTSFVAPAQEAPQEAAPETPAPVPAPPSNIPTAPVREDRRPFSTRVRPSQKAMLDRYVMDLKLAGWPISQEGVLEELLRLLHEDEQVRATITARLTQRS